MKLPATYDNLTSLEVTLLVKSVDAIFHWLSYSYKTWTPESKTPYVHC